MLRSKPVIPVLQEVRTRPGLWMEKSLHTYPADGLFELDLTNRQDLTDKIILESGTVIPPGLVRDWQG